MVGLGATRLAGGGFSELRTAALTGAVVIGFLLAVALAGGYERRIVGQTVQLLRRAALGALALVALTSTVALAAEVGEARRILLLGIAGTWALACGNHWSPSYSYHGIAHRSRSAGSL